MSKQQRKAKKQKARESPSEILRHKWARSLWVTVGQKVFLWGGSPVYFDDVRYAEVIEKMLIDNCRPEESIK